MKADWYPDAQSEGKLLRWWDGYAWTEYTTVAPVPDPAAPAIPAVSSFTKPVTLPKASEFQSGVPKFQPAPELKSVRRVAGDDKPAVPGVEGRTTPSSPPLVPSFHSSLSRTATGAIPVNGLRANSKPVANPFERGASVPVSPANGTHAGAAGLSYGLTGEGAPQRPNSVASGKRQSGFDPHLENWDEADAPNQSMTSPPQAGQPQAGEQLPNLTGPSGGGIPPSEGVYGRATKESGNRKFWTKTSIAVVAASLLAGVLVPVGFNAYKGSVYETADANFEGFLAATAAGKGWEKYVTPDTFDPYYTPLYGSAEAAELSGMKVTVSEISNIYYVDPCNGGDYSDVASYFTNETPTGCSDKALADVDITYEIGDSYKAVGQAYLVATRPFYYGDDKASEAVKGKKPTKIGEWSISNISYQDSYSDEMKPYTQPNAEEMPRWETCGELQDVLVSMSETARINEQLSGECAVEKELRGTGKNVTPEELMKTFPIYNETSVIEIDNKVGYWNPGYETSFGYLQQELKTESGTYILSFISGESVENIPVYQLLSITKKKTTVGDDETATEEEK